MTRRERRLARMAGQPEQQVVTLSIDRLTLDGVSPHVGRRIAESLTQALTARLSEAEEVPDAAEADRAGVARLTVGPHDLPERIGEGLARVVAGRVLP